MTAPLADAVSSAAGTGAARIRTGTVVAITSAQVSVRLADATIAKAVYLDTVTTLQVGDVVVMLQDGPRLVILGRPTGSGISLLPNNSFELVDGSLPRNWTIHHTGSPAVVAVLTGDAFHGTRFLKVEATGATPGIDTFILSAAVPVIAGQSWQLSAQVQGAYSGQPVRLGGILGAAWFDRAETSYPATVAPDSHAQTNTAVGEGAWTGLAGQVTVPGNARFMRVFLDTYSPAGVAAALFWDLTDARRHL